MSELPSPHIWRSSLKEASSGEKEIMKTQQVEEKLPALASLIGEAASDQDNKVNNAAVGGDGAAAATSNGDDNNRMRSLSLLS